MARKTTKNEPHIIPLTAATLAKQAEVMYLKGRVHVQEHPKEYKAAGLGALVGGVIVALMELA